MNKLLVVLLVALCLVAVHGKKKAALKEEKEAFQSESESPKQEGAEEAEDDSAKAEPESEQLEEDQSELGPEEGSGDDEEAEDTKQFSCNLKFKKVGCYADKSKKQKPLKSFIMSDADMAVQTKRGKLPAGDTFNTELPKFACKCANEAMNSGSAIFGIQNIAECWSGPDSSKYDKDGPSEDCVTFDFAQCAAGSEICAGKKHANFVYYVDSPEHNKSAEDLQKELVQEAKKKRQQKKKAAANKKKAKKLNKKKNKKSKKE